jgi:hypothetical protein
VLILGSFLIFLLLIGFIEQITQEDDTVYGIYGDHQIRTKLEAPSSDFKEVLGIRIKTNFKGFYGEFNKQTTCRLYWEISTSP